MEKRALLSSEFISRQRISFSSGMPWPVTAEMKTTGMSSGKSGGDFVAKFVVEHVGFGYGQHTVLVHEFGVELAQFAEQHLIVLADIVGIGRNHEEQYGVPARCASGSGDRDPSLRGRLR